MTLKACIKSFRLRTLPQSLSGIALGIGLAASEGRGVSFPVVFFLVLTAVFLQILSNLSNELGDALRGTDSASGRLGMHYSLMDGEMTLGEMKRLIFCIAGVSCVMGLAMIWFSFASAGMWGISAGFVVLGALTITAAMRYTLGHNPYGYRGLGDLFVFIFFGLVATLGAGYIVNHSFSWMWLMPASAAGLFGAGVLNVNNTRDMKTDAATRKTVALRLGLRGARIYQTMLIVIGWGLLVCYSIIVPGTALRWIYLMTSPLFVLHLRGVWTRTERALDPMLPMLVLSTFATSLLFTLGLVLS